MNITNTSSSDFLYSDTIPVIASFDSQGHIAPLYVRINHIPLKVESFWISSTFHNIVEFKCKVSDGNYLKPLLLRFHCMEGMWTIPK